MRIQIDDTGTKEGAMVASIVAATFTLYKESSAFIGARPVLDGINNFHLVYATPEQRTSWYGKFINAVQEEANKHGIKVIASVSDEEIKFTVGGGNAGKTASDDGSKKRSKRRDRAVSEGD